jgi:CO dehydrogenase/acetyl-CoA synthase beta subunit
VDDDDYVKQKTHKKRNYVLKVMKINNRENMWKQNGFNKTAISKQNGLKKTKKLQQQAVVR